MREGMSAESVIGLVLGSTVLGGVIGAFLQSARQREEVFRERMIDRSVAFLATVATAQRALSDAHRGVLRQLEKERPASEEVEATHGAIETAADSVRGAWPFIPVLLVVFPGQEVARAAGSLVDAMTELLKSIGALQEGREEPAETLSRFEQVEEKHLAYAELVNQAIRRRAFRRKSFGR
jgi:hypothetical protein